jgi:hypothetical protein
MDAYVVLACVAGATASFLAVRNEDLSRKRWFRVTGLAVFVLLLILTWHSIKPSMEQGGRQSAMDFIVAMGAVMVVCLCWAMFFVTSIGGTLANITRGMLSLDDIRIPPPYSLVDAAISKRDYPTALDRLLEVIRDYPEESGALRRLGDLYLLMDRPDDALASYRRAMEVEPDPGQKLLYIFNASEVLADLRHDPVAALTEIERFLASYPEVKGRVFAEERMTRLRRRISGVRGPA